MAVRGALAATDRDGTAGPGWDAHGIASLVRHAQMPFARVCALELVAFAASVALIASATAGLLKVF